VHDLLPIRLEDFFLPFVKPWYDSWMRCVARTADAVVCNSQATAADFRAWLDEVGDDRGLAARTHWMRLASTLGNSSIVTPELRQRPRGTTRVLCVGTIEPRKAYEVLLDAAEQLWQRGEHVEFTIVGRPGWVDKQTFARLAALSAPGRLRWLSDASDLDLQWEYLNADLLVMPSRAEGFGLPVVEALAHGVSVLARDIPVFREILGPEGNYFLLDRDLPEAILRALRSDAPLAYLPDRVVTWTETADDLLLAMRSGESSGRPLAPIYAASRGA
jgi:alpha-1,2-rhamnosyltransferase